MGEQLTVVLIDPDGTLRRVLKNTHVPPDWTLESIESSDPDAIPACDVLVVQNAPVGRKTLGAVRGLQHIQKFGRRTENIDLASTREFGISVGTMPLEHGVWVAEHTLMLMLALTKQLVPAHAGVVGNENPDGIAPFCTTQTNTTYNWTGLTGRGALFRRTLGIVGLGEIGTEVAIRAKSFAMEVEYYNPAQFRLRPEAEVELDVTFQPLPALLAHADFVTLHIPHTQETENFIGAQEFERMKSGVYLINCSRGGVVDEAALVSALAENRIAGAGLDVFEYEPLPADSRLLTLDNVILTPHIAGGPLETLAAEGRELVERVVRATSGDK